MSDSYSECIFRTACGCEQRMIIPDWIDEWLLELEQAPNPARMISVPLITESIQKRIIKGIVKKARVATPMAAIAPR